MTPEISVVVPSRNRADHAEACVRSILDNLGDDIEVLLVDQSEDDATERALCPLKSDPRFRYVRTSTRGASAARNVGIEKSVAPLIAFTDDDCRVARNWLAEARKIFDRDPDAALVFGRVSIPEELKGKGFAADFEPHQREYSGRFPPAGVAWGIGANMSLRRALLDRIGKFDPLLGPGAPFNAGEETDLAIRALAAGFKVVNAAEVAVLHLGVRESDDATKLMRGYGEAVGAAFAKHVRLGTQKSGTLLVSWVTHFGVKGLRNAVLGRRPTGIGLVLGMLWGASRSLAQPIDRVGRVYTTGDS